MVAHLPANISRDGVKWKAGKMGKATKPRKVRRAPRGTGSVFYSKSRGCWIARKPIGTRTVRGKKHTVYVTRTGRTAAEAIRRRDAALPPEPTVLMSEWCDRWLAGLTHRPLTMDRYRHSVSKWIKPVLGSVPVQHVTAHTVELAVRKWGESISANTILLVLAHLGACLGAAVRARLIPTNPVASAKKPKATKVKLEVYTPDELARIIAACGRGEGIIACLAATGLRRGEAIALLVSDFDAKAGTISVTKTEVGKHGIGPPKSAHSLRTIRVPAVALPHIRGAVGGRKSGPLFLSDAGKRMNATTIANRLAALLKRLELPAKSPHKLRHSVATALNGAGVPVADAAAYIGDTVDVYVRSYLHANPGSDPAVMLDALFADKGGKPARRRA